MPELVKPAIRALIGWYEEPFGLIKSKLVSLEAAVDYQQFGAWVLVDPGDETNLATWEREQRVVVRRRYQD